MKTCTRCKEEKSLEDFYRQKKKSGNHIVMSHCKGCHAKSSRDRYHRLTPNERHEAYVRDRHKALRKFNLTHDQFEEMEKQQGGVCKICKRPETSMDSRAVRVRRLAVDHDRTCCPGEGSCGKCIRGLLCLTCNTRVGYFEKYGLIDSLLSYLKIEVVL